MAVLAFLAAAFFFAPGAPALGGADSGHADLAARTRAVAGDGAGYHGLAVATIEDGRIRLAGLGEAGGGRPVDGDTAFEPGSVTKTWTAMLLADMLAKGEVRTSDTLGTLLPGRTFADPAVRDITVEELASHRSGLPSLAPRGGFGPALRQITAPLRGADPYAGISAADLLGALDGLRLEQSKGTVRYSNFGMSVLGHALAERAGTPYDRLVTDRVLAPAGMDATVFRPDGAAPPPTAATGTTMAGREVDPWSGSGYQPAGIGEWTTADDLAAFLAATVAGTAPGADATTPRFREDETGRIGYAWFTTRYGDREITWHNGTTGGSSAYVAYEPATKRGVVVLGNTDRSVMPVGLALLGVEDGPGTTPERERVLWIGLTLVLLLGALGPVGTLALNGRLRWWPAPDRQRLVAGVASGAASLAVAHLLGTWLALPGLLWAAAFAALAGAAVYGVLRWRSLPAGAGGTARIVSTGVTVAFSAAILGVVLVYG